MVGLSSEVNTIVKWPTSNPVLVQMYLLEEDMKRGRIHHTHRRDTNMFHLFHINTAMKGSYKIFCCQFKWSGRGGGLLGKKMLSLKKDVADRQETFNSNTEVLVLSSNCGLLYVSHLLGPTWKHIFLTPTATNNSNFAWKSP